MTIRERFVSHETGAVKRSARNRDDDGELDHVRSRMDRRRSLSGGSAAAGAALTAGVCGLLVPARARCVAPTPFMRGGGNNRLPCVPIVERIGGAGSG
jgi:hypothetical protein